MLTVFVGNFNFAKIEETDGTDDLKLFFIGLKSVVSL